MLTPVENNGNRLLLELAFGEGLAGSMERRICSVHKVGEDPSNEVGLPENISKEFFKKRARLLLYSLSACCKIKTSNGPII